MENSITVVATIKAPITEVWDKWTNPKHIVHWNFASDDWHTPHAESDLREGGKFISTMAAKDGSFQFDFGGIFTQVNAPNLLAYTMEDGRLAMIKFEAINGETVLTETFQMERENSEELRRTGWQAILDNFKKYVESK